MNHQRNSTPNPRAASSPQTPASASGGGYSPYRSLSVEKMVVGAPSSRNGAPVYRSLAVAPAVAADPFTAALASLAVGDKVVPAPTSASVVPRLPLPLNLYPLARTHRWFAVDDAGEVCAKVEAALVRAVGDAGSVALARAANKCRFDCSVAGEAAMETCDFAVHVFDAKGDDRAPARFLVEAQRHSGCPFLFNQVLERSFHQQGASSPSSGGDPICAPTRRFVPPPLPADVVSVISNEPLVDETAEVMIQMSLSNVYEQRIQATCALADTCVRDPSFAKRVARLGGAVRMQALLRDGNPIVRRAADRVIKSCV